MVIPETSLDSWRIESLVTLRMVTLVYMKRAHVKPWHRAGPKMFKCSPKDLVRFSREEGCPKKTINSADSLLVTDATTKTSMYGLAMGDRTGFCEGDFEVFSPCKLVPVLLQRLSSCSPRDWCPCCTSLHL